MSNSLVSARTDEQKNEIKHKNLQADQKENFSSKDVSKTSSVDVKLLFFVSFALLAGWFFWFRKRR